MNSKVYCISVNLRRLGIRKKVSSETDAVTTSADRDFLHVHKDILQCKEYEAILSLYGKIRTYLKGKTAGNSYLRDGIYLVNAAKLSEVTTWLEGKSVELADLTQKFLDVYAKVKDEAKVKLGDGLYNELDYPAVDRVRAAFGLSWNVFSFPSVDLLREAEPEIYQQESQKIKALFEEALNESRNLLRTEVNGYVQHLVDRLTPGDNGKVKRIHESAVANVTDFIKDFQSREITNDSQLQEVLADLQKVMATADPEKLRKKTPQGMALREGVRQKLEEAKVKVDALITTGSRFYALDDEFEVESAVA